ncbi:UDP-glucose 4-epimerase (EC [Olavius algarvensis associated proteobacterium Delta 3]|nr:UDP-glucose 4-epimerase (EC [Olavius algarvensis associated proteobacterium Delta 3]CAB5123116.1 UDP-glucose 4-epimerase (EC [Olavius algarvensis associated proteobacterium Delta 3]
MKILVAGGAGYIGSTIIPKLLERGYDVDVIDLLWFGNHLPDRVKIIQKDIFRVEEKDLKGYDQIIFLAGLSNDPMAEFSPSQNFIDNASAPSYLAYIAKRAGVRRYIYGSSCSVYGYTVEELYDETRPTISNYPYGISKLQGEFGAMKQQDDSFSVISLRQGTVCGYSPRMRLDLIVNTMFKCAIEDGVITVNNPAIWRPILDIRDAAKAYVRSIETNGQISGVFNVASGNYTVGEVGDYVQEGLIKYLDIHPKMNIKHIEDYRNYKVSIQKANEVLGFKPTFSVVDTIKSLVDNLDSFRDFESDQYYNIQTFKNIKHGN